MQSSAPLAQASSKSLARVGIVLSLALGVLVSSGWSSLSVRKDLDTIIAMAPAPVLVKKGQELRMAEAAAAQVTGAQAYIGAGSSMMPIYASGTAIVVTPCDFADLRPGMSVLYVNDSGRGVAHVLVKQTRNGWVAQGVNNPERDADLVTARNLVGVVTQAYASADTSLRQEVASRTMLKLVNAGGIRVASNL